MQGETQQALDVISNPVLVNSSVSGGYRAGVASEAMEGPCPIPAEHPHGRYLLACDP